MLLNTQTSALVGSDSSVDPGAQLGDAGVHYWETGVTSSGSPGHRAYQSPDPWTLTHQRTTRITLWKTHIWEQQQHWYDNVFLLDLSSYTWQDEEPEAPAQIMASVILLWPQICVHTAGLMMGTPVCCRIWGLAKKKERRNHDTLHCTVNRRLLFSFCFTADLHVVAVLPQPVVKQRVPGRMLMVDGARHTGEIRGVNVTGDDSFSRAMSLLKVALL